MVFVKKIPMTAQGFLKLQEELKELKAERPKIREALEEARKLGDFSENAELDAAKDRQGFVEARIRELEDKVSRAEVIEASKLTGSRVRFGATVVLSDIETEQEIRYQIVGEDESDIKSGRLSIASPLASALIGKEEGDAFEATTPRGKKNYEILSVSYV